MSLYVVQKCTINSGSGCLSNRISVSNPDCTPATFLTSQAQEDFQLARGTGWHEAAALERSVKDTGAPPRCNCAHKEIH